MKYLTKHADIWFACLQSDCQWSVAVLFLQKNPIMHASNGMLFAFNSKSGFGFGAIDQRDSHCALVLMSNLFPLPIFSAWIPFAGNKKDNQQAWCFLHSNYAVTSQWGMVHAWKFVNFEIVELCCLFAWQICVSARLYKTVFWSEASVFCLQLPKCHCIGHDSVWKLTEFPLSHKEWFKVC